MDDLQLSDDVRAGLAPEQAKRLSRLGYWNLSAASRRTQLRLGWSASRRRRVEREYRRYLGLIALNPAKPYGVCGDVDEVWHDHLLHTEDYMEMCRDVMGAMIHHYPAQPSRRRPAKASPSAYDANTYPDLARTYRGRVSSVWPQSGDDQGVAKCCGHGVSTQPL